MGSLRDFLIDVGRNAYGLGENVASLGSAAIAEPVAGYAAMFDPINGAQAIREGMTYQPRTEAGKMYQQGAAKTLGAMVKPAMPIVDTWQKGVDIAGRYSPVAGAALQTVPTALGVALGAKSTLQAGRQASNTLGAMQARMIANANAPRTLNTGFGGQRGVFAGINALTADKEALAKAQKMIAQGVDPEDVWEETGWGRGADGKWRFEINDKYDITDDGKETGSSLNYNNGVLSQLSSGEIGLARGNQLLNHDDLYSAYPELKTISIRQDFDDLGYYDNNGNIGISSDILKGALGGRDIGKTNNAHSVLLHELQHAIQKKEGFAKGGSPEQFEGMLFSSGQIRDAKILVNLMKKGKTIDEAIKEFNDLIRRDPLPGVKSLVKYNPDPKSIYAMTHDPYEAYKRLAGEVESRMVQNRIDLSPQQRLEKYPFDFRTYGYDVPIDYQNIDLDTNASYLYNQERNKGGKQ